MARKYSTSYYPGPALTKYLEECAPISDSPRKGRSAILDRALDRYRAVIRTSLPLWKIDQWSRALEVLQTMDLWPTSAVDVLGLVLQQGLEKRRAAGESDPDNFAYHAKSLSVPARIAVAEVVERYFKKHGVITNEAVTALLAEMGAPGF